MRGRGSSKPWERYRVGGGGNVRPWERFMAWVYGEGGQPNRGRGMMVVHVREGQSTMGRGTEPNEKRGERG